MCSPLVLDNVPIEKVIEKAKEKTGIEDIEWKGSLNYREFREKTEEGSLEDGLYLLASTGAAYFVYKEKEFSWL